MSDENRRGASVMELELLARIADAVMGEDAGMGDKIVDVLRDAYRRGAEDMRERAAERATTFQGHADGVAAAIRALPVEEKR